MTFNQEKGKAVETEEQPRFSEEQLVSEKHMIAAGIAQPSFTQLKSSLEKYGPEGILESAIHLPEDQYDKLEALVRKTPAARVVRRRRRHG